MRLEDDTLPISDSVMSESIIEVKVFNEKFSTNYCKLHKAIEDSPDTIPTNDTSSNCKESENRSDLIKFSTNTCEAVDKRTDYVLASISDQFLPKPIADIGKDTRITESNDLPNIKQQNWYKEVSSQELPLTLHKPKQSATTHMDCDPIHTHSTNEAYDAHACSESNSTL